MSGGESSWSVTDLSASAFLADSEVMTAAQLSSLWSQLFPDKPILETSPVDEQEEDAPRWVAGALGVPRAILESSAGRVDLALRFPMTADEALSAPVQFEPRWSEFLEMSRRFLALAGSMRRFALGAQLVRPYNGPDALLASLRELVPVDFGEHAADFVYQINRYKPYPLPDQRDFCINRIARWSVVELALKRADLTTVRLPSCALILDLNTDARRTSPLASDHVESILSVFAESGPRFARYGDRAKEE